MQLVSRKRLGFRTNPLHSKLEPRAMDFLSQRVSFWIAAFTVVAFITGNMVGQHGWHVFWESVMGKEDDSLIVYTGTVTPIDLVPDYVKWASYGGDPSIHTFRQVPASVLVPLPAYDSSYMQSHDHDHGKGADVYSVGHLGSYTTGSELSGSHPGVDIRVPEGTPVRSVANGVVTDVKNEPGGYGKVLVIKHPNAPDPDRPGKTTTLHSVYAHLSSIIVEPGMIVMKGENVAYSGRTGNVTGPHLHFQIDRDEAPWHPYWPFTAEDARKAGLAFYTAVDSTTFQSRGALYTVNPMLYVQSNLSVRTGTVVASRSSSSATAIVERGPQLSRADLVRKRLEERRTVLAARQTVVVSRVSSSSSKAPTMVASNDTAHDIEPMPEPAVVTEVIVIPSVDDTTSAVAALDIRHDGSFAGRGWEKIRISLLDADGREVTGGLSKDLVLRTAFGKAEFRPAVLSPLDFENGVATVQMLPRGTQTVVIQALPFQNLSQPLIYEGR